MTPTATITATVVSSTIPETLNSIDGLSKLVEEFGYYVAITAVLLVAIIECLKLINPIFKKGKVSVVSMLILTIFFGVFGLLSGYVSDVAVYATEIVFASTIGYIVYDYIYGLVTKRK